MIRATLPNQGSHPTGWVSDAQIREQIEGPHDTCYSEFTSGQSTRMQQQYLHWRVKHGYSPPR